MSTKGNKNALGNRGGTGAPTKYKPEFAEMAFKIALLGATDAQLAGVFDVCERTIANWKGEHPEFFAALKRGKDAADGEVANSLYRRALGYEHDAVKIVADAKTGAEHVVPYTERYPPDTTAAIFWLKNRQPKAWRDRHEVTGEDGGPLGILVLPQRDPVPEPE